MSKMQEQMDRWSAERYILAEKSVLEVLNAEGATFTEPLSRAGLRMVARKRIHDNGLLDNFLKHVGGKIAPAGTDQIWLYFVSGWVAGAASRTATAPLDRLKVALQVQMKPAAAIPAFSKIWREDGLLGFFRGNGLNIAKTVPETALKFYAYEKLKNVIGDIKQEKGDIGTSGRIVAGGLAGAVAQTAIYPLDLIKTRLQTYPSQSGKVPNLGTLTKAIWIEEGPLAFYRGLVPSLVGLIPYAGIDLAIYQTLKDMSKRYILDDCEPGPLTQLGCGTVSGALGATCVYPLHVIRTRLQAQPSNLSDSYKGISDVFWRTLEHEGFRGFYKGLLPNLLKVVPAASVTFVVYETVKKSLSELSLN